MKIIHLYYNIFIIALHKFLLIRNLSNVYIFYSVLFYSILYILFCSVYSNLFCLYILFLKKVFYKILKKKFYNLKQCVYYDRFSLVIISFVFQYKNVLEIPKKSIQMKLCSVVTCSYITTTHLLLGRLPVIMVLILSLFLHQRYAI